METQNTPPPAQFDQAQALQAHVQQSKKSFKMRLFAGFALVAILIAGYFGYQNPDLFRAAITESTVPAGEAGLYIPNYEASMGDSGEIAIKTKANIQNVHSIQFTLKTNPVNALAFNENSLVFDNETVFKSADLKSVNTDTPGETIISFFSSSPISVQGVDANEPTTHQALVKLSTQINPNLPAGTTIELAAEDVEVVILDNGNIQTSTDYTAIDAGSIALESQDELKLLYAETIDSTHVLLHFSDLLTNVGSQNSFDISPALNVIDIARGDFQGYAQDTILLTTAVQNASQKYLIEVNNDFLLLGNSEGALNESYNQALFVGFGAGQLSLNEFGMVSAQATGLNTAKITFTEPVATASVFKEAFSSPGLTVVGAEAQNDSILLTFEEPLLKNQTYVVQVSDPVASNAPTNSDGQALGINQIGFTGSASGPRVESVVATADAEDPESGTLTITFSESVTAEVNGTLGSVHTTGSTDSVFLLDTDDENVTLDGAVVIVNGLPTDAATNYTFVSNTAVSGGGLPVDPSYNSLTFWGAGYDEALNTVGAVSVTKAKTFVVQSGSLDFSELDNDDVFLINYDHPTQFNDHAISNIALENGNLKVTTEDSLELNTHYIVGFKDDEGSTLQATEFVLESDFAVVGAQLLGPNQVKVTFSENLDQSTVDLNAFSFIDDNASVSSVEVDQSTYQSVILTTDSTLFPGTIYGLEISGIRSFVGGEPLVLNFIAFPGYFTQSDVGNVSVQSVESLSSTQVQVVFSDFVDPATVTPVNMSILHGFSFSEKLIIHTVETTDNKTFILTTDVQDSEVNYIFTPTESQLILGVKDLQGKLLNNNTLLNFFGFETLQPKLSALSPSTVTNDVSQSIVISGEHLGEIESVLVDGEVVDISEVSENGLSLTFVLTSGFETGSHSITLISKTGVQETYDDALVVSEAQTPMAVISEESKSTPFKVPNDGETEVTLWALVEDMKDIDNVDSVTINLEPIGGSPAQLMEKAEENKTQFRQWYFYKTTVPATVATSSEPTELAVEAVKGDETATGFATIHVTADVYKSVAPVINQAFFLPISVAPDGKTPVKISAQVSDADGAFSITSVVANLGSLGVGFIPLNEVEGVETAGETVSRFFESDEFTIPITTPTSTYQISLTAQDATGEVGTLDIPFNVSTELSGPDIDDNQSYLSPNPSIPHDSTTPFAVNVFVSDPDGVGDIESVTAQFGTLGISPKSLTKSAEVTDVAKSAWFTVEGLTVPTSASLGIHQITVTATDSSGSSDNTILQLDVTAEDVYGEPPYIYVDKAYTTPAVVVNDGQTPFTLHTFVDDDDDDIETVFVNLANVGQVGPQSSGEFTLAGDAPEAASGSDPCSTNSATLVCLQPSVKEGNDGQWFVLSGITISDTVVPGSEPLMVQIVAVDTSGKSTTKSVPIHINTGDASTYNSAPPAVLAAVSTSESSVEIVFSEPLNVNSISTSGSGFSIVDQDDINKSLGIVAATVNAAGTVVTLTTETQSAGKAYVLQASSDVKDAVGVALVAGQSSNAAFAGFDPEGKPPVVEYIAPSDVDIVEVEFRDPIKPSSLKLSNFEIKESGLSNAKLSIFDVQFVESAKVVQLTTDLQKPGQRYRLTIKNIVSADGMPLSTTINKLFKGLKASAAASAGLSASADLNGDGKIDFTDFTMFSAVYGTSLFGSESDDSSASFGVGQPLDSTPDATVPITSPLSN